MDVPHRTARNTNAKVPHGKSKPDRTEAQHIFFFACLQALRRDVEVALLVLAALYTGFGA